MISDNKDKTQKRFQMTKVNGESGGKKSIGKKIKHLFKDKEEPPETVALCVAEDFGFVANEDGGIEFDYRGFQEDLNFIWENIVRVNSDDGTIYTEKTARISVVKVNEEKAPAFNLVRTVSNVFAFGSKSDDQEEKTTKKKEKAKAKKEKKIIEDIDSTSLTPSWFKRKLVKKSKKTKQQEKPPVAEGKKDAPLRGGVPVSAPDRMEVAYDFVKAVSNLNFGATKTKVDYATKSNLDKYLQKSGDKRIRKNKSPLRTERKPVVAGSACADSKNEDFQVSEKENDQDAGNVAVEFVRAFSDLTFGAANVKNMKGSNKTRASIPIELTQDPSVKHNIHDKHKLSRGDRSVMSEYTGMRPLQNQRAHGGRSVSGRHYSQNHKSRGDVSVMTEQSGKNATRKRLSQGEKSVKSEYIGRRPLQKSPQAVHEPYRMGRQTTGLTTDLSVMSGFKPVKNASKLAPKSPTRKSNSKAASNTALRSGIKNTVIRSEGKGSRYHNSDNSFMDYRDDEQLLSNRRQEKGLRDDSFVSVEVTGSDSSSSSSLSQKMIRTRLKRSSDDRTVETFPEPDSSFLVVTNLRQEGKVVRNLVSVKNGLKR